MKNSIFLLICLLVTVAAKAQSPQPSWRTYVMKEADLRFTVPMFPSSSVTKEKRDRQKHVFDSSADGVDYKVFVIENPEPRQSLDEFIKEGKNSKLDPASERDVTVDGFAGKAFVYRDGKGMAQFLATETYLFEFRAKGAPVDDARLTRFFSSITLKKRATDPSVPTAAGNSSDSDKVFTQSDVDNRPKTISRPDVRYTEEAKNDRIIGTVILRCVFTSKGTVTNCRVVQGLPKGLTEQSIEAAKKIKFIPATKDGKPVSMWMQLEYNFNTY